MGNIQSTINRLHRRSGHLWQALQYVEQNPLRAGMVRQAWEYPFSNSGAHVEGKDPTGILNLPYWRQISTKMNWREILEKHQPKHLICPRLFGSTLTKHTEWIIVFGDPTN